MSEKFFHLKLYHKTLLKFHIKAQGFKFKLKSEFSLQIINQKKYNCFEDPKVRLFNLLVSLITKNLQLSSNLY